MRCDILFQKCKVKAVYPAVAVDVSTGELFLLDAVISEKITLEEPYIALSDNAVAVHVAFKGGLCRHYHDTEASAGDNCGCKLCGYPG